MSALLELAERVEAATGPDRELDCVIHEAVSGFVPRAGGVGWPENALIVPDFPGWRYLDAYTASLDAAMTLVPEGWDFRLRRDCRGIRAIVWRPQRNVGFDSEATTLPLALVAAALKARAAQADAQ